MVLLSMIPRGFVYESFFPVRSFCASGQFSIGGSPFPSPTKYGTLIKKDPKKDPNLENYPYTRMDAKTLFQSVRAAGWFSFEGVLHELKY